MNTGTAITAGHPPGHDVRPDHGRRRTGGAQPLGREALGGGVGVHYSAGACSGVAVFPAGSRKVMIEHVASMAADPIRQAVTPPH